jgi:hypothetical protein
MQDRKDVTGELRSLCYERILVLSNASDQKREHALALDQGSASVF